MIVRVFGSWENFCLEDNYEETVQRLRNLRADLSKSIDRYFELGGSQQKKKARLPSFLDFSTIRRCTPSSALVLATEFDRARSIVPWNIHLINLRNWRRDLVDLMDEIGFFRLLEIPRPEVAAKKRSDVAVVRFQTGHTFGNNEAGSLMLTLATMIANADPEAMMDPLTSALPVCRADWGRFAQLNKSSIQCDPGRSNRDCIIFVTDTFPSESTRN